jgi:cytidine deaminase
MRRRIGIMFALAACAALATAIAIVAVAGDKASPERNINVQDIPETTVKDLIGKAKDASKKAYAPYSKFSVGAAVLTDSGDVFTGCNVENASYGLTICAERNAVFQMVAQAKRKIKMVVIYTPPAKPSAPCGACRQVVNEFGPDALILSVCDGPDVLRKKLSDLLPDAFGPANLK